MDFKFQSDEDREYRAFKIELPAEKLPTARFQYDSAGAIQALMDEYVIGLQESFSINATELTEAVGPGLGYGLTSMVDWLDVRHDWFGNVNVVVRVVGPTARVWLLFAPVRTVVREPGTFEYDHTRLRSNDWPTFWREFQRHPNHATLMAFFLFYASVYNLGTGRAAFQASVHWLRKAKKGLLEAVLDRARSYAIVENLFLEYEIEFERGTDNGTA